MGIRKAFQCEAQVPLLSESESLLVKTTQLRLEQVVLPVLKAQIRWLKRKAAAGGFPYQVMVSDLHREVNATHFTIKSVSSHSTRNHSFQSSSVNA